MASTHVSDSLHWIAADWGTSSLRLWAMSQDGAVLARAASQDGMGGLTPDRYESVLLALIGDWLPVRPVHTVPVVVCGMAGARQGWREAAYRSVPCAPVAGGAMTPVATSDARIAVSIIPGLLQASPADVMRGEETQLAGLVARIGSRDAIACMPGTHSKWVRIENGQVAGFTTVMTGEIFALLANHSVLRHSVAIEGEDRQAFASAVREMMESPERLTASLFSVRAASLLSGVDGTSGRARLSGLLIGAELAAMRMLWSDNPVHLIGSGPLSAAYGEALRIAGGDAVIEMGEALTLAGLRVAYRTMEREAA